MRAVVQRVREASVTVDGAVTGSIGKGYLVLLGVGEGDTKADADRIVKKLVNLRIFPDENDKINLSLRDINGSLLLISQFTLYANCRKGNRPSFTDAGNPDMANEMYEYIIAECKKQIPNVQTGIFGADMKLEIHNDGPFTIILDSRDLAI